MTKVKLRKKAITGKRQTLYLDFYPPIPNPDTGKPTRREFLKLYVFDKPKTPVQKDHNKETEALAENIRAKRQIEIQNGQHGFLSKQGNVDFVIYFEMLANKRKSSNHDNWISALHYLKGFTGGQLMMKNLNERICNDFKDYLLNSPSKRSHKRPLSQNSAHSYFNKFKAALKQAFRDGYLSQDLNSRISPIKQAETEREFLTQEELQALVETECENDILKSAALFSSLTGLRFSDIQRLTWSQIQHSENGGYFVQFRQKKTEGVEVLPISQQAFSLLGTRSGAQEIVFSDLKYSAYNNQILKRWVKSAEISKNITFHCFRHTFATLQLTLGTDLYTVSKLLGHREIKTTQVYAKIVDKLKIEAVNRIKLKF